MKWVYSLLAVFLVLNVAHSIDLQFVDEMVKCGEEMGLTPDQVKDMMAKQDEKLGCINACVMKKLGGLENGQLHRDNLFALLDQNKDTIPNYTKIREDLQVCYDEASNAADLPECQLARKFTMCMHNHMQN